MILARFGVAVVLGLAITVPAVAQQPTVRVDGDDVTVTGCVVRAAQSAAVPQTLVWTRGEIMLAGAEAAAGQANPIGTSGISGRVFYWLNDDEDLGKHIGQRVEIKGDLEDFEEGKIKIERDGEFTDIELDIDGREEKARVPNAWLGPDAPGDTEFKIVAREIDVDEIRVLGACNN